ncbi:hypothetical protein L226DRAFT_270124 [Lentinus tigrinus ALCF2SS1-7]|uniref:uncharacterized protein n=1 Tax=Lentinus tigrinus ALCF2SS1-7 TaxID=1328758 RepID=UPI0011660E1A|nr:hypothetical protein L226DRAFT_270124 [Lentinus tigrinus ALCF2SS1-7]
MLLLSWGHYGTYEMTSGLVGLPHRRSHLDRCIIFEALQTAANPRRARHVIVGMVARGVYTRGLSATAPRYPPFEEQCVCMSQKLNTRELKRETSTENCSWF